MSFLPSPPEHIFFFAAEIPKDMVGGESPLVDLRAVARNTAIPRFTPAIHTLN